MYHFSYQVFWPVTFEIRNDDDDDDEDAASAGGGWW